MRSKLQHSCAALYRILTGSIDISKSPFAMLLTRPHLEFTFFTFLSLIQSVYSGRGACTDCRGVSGRHRSAVSVAGRGGRGQEQDTVFAQLWGNFFGQFYLSFFWLFKKSHIEKELNALARQRRQEQETQTQKFSSCHLGGLMDGDKLFAHVYNNTSSFQCNWHTLNILSSLAACQNSGAGHRRTFTHPCAGTRSYTKEMFL